MKNAFFSAGREKVEKTSRGFLEKVFLEATAPLLGAGYDNGNLGPLMDIGFLRFSMLQ